VVTHGGADDQLEINRQHADAGEGDKSPGGGEHHRGARGGDPPTRTGQCREHRQAEECLRDASVKDREVQVDQHHPQSAQRALEDHTAKDSKGKNLHGSL
jgi:hypothetical protein